MRLRTDCPSTEDPSCYKPGKDPIYEILYMIEDRGEADIKVFLNISTHECKYS